MNYKKLKVIISGGGTGGHIFPAISIANKLMELNPETEILFIGAKGKMEMEKVPTAGYKIVGLPIVGLQRQLNLRNLINDIQVPFKWVASQLKVSRVIRDFAPDIAIGVGGYASAAAIKVAQKQGIPTLLQEQNSFAGLSNKMLAQDAGRICVAYEGMERFFPAEKIVMTGNPIRSDIRPATPEMREQGRRYYSLDPSKKHILIVGGSLGSGTLNKTMMKWIRDGRPGGYDVDVLWQHGKYYHKEVEAFMSSPSGESGWKVDKVENEALGELTYAEAAVNVRCREFIDRMDLAYAAADLVISRAGASTVSELCAAHKAAIFVPSPNVAEDHQTHNAMALVDKGAALMVPDASATELLMRTAIAALKSQTQIECMERNIAALALPDAATSIAYEVYKLLT